VAAGSGYLKNAGSEFSMQNFAETVFEGAVTLIDYVKKTLTRRVFPWLMRKLNKPA
jgi:hypothetical protein